MNSLKDSTSLFKWERVKMKEEEMEDDLVTLDCIIGILKDPKHLSSLIPTINQLLPLSTWQLDHLKRIKKDQENILVFLYPVATTNINHLEILELFKETKLMKIPKYPAYTKEQFDRQSLLWPTVFHLNQKVPKDLELEDAQRAKDFFINNFEFINCNNNCAIVTDDNFEIKVKSFSLPQHPLGHACLNAIDSISKLERRNNSTSITKHSSSSTKDYLCTGNSLFIWREPCVMCSMALVHSRIKRVFFYEANPECGGLMSQVKIGYLKQLNHHFISYQLRKII